MKKIMKRAAVATVLALTLAGCGLFNQDGATPSNAPSGGVPFMPAYLEMLYGKAPQDNACRPGTGADLLLPCDQP